MWFLWLSRPLKLWASRQSSNCLFFFKATGVCWFHKQLKKRQKTPNSEVQVQLQVLGAREMILLVDDEAAANEALWGTCWVWSAALQSSFVSSHILQFGLPKLAPASEPGLLAPPPALWARINFWHLVNQSVTCFKNKSNLFSFSSVILLHILRSAHKKDLRQSIKYCRYTLLY